jgi:HAE1 family hydrophobic/amphiphilic exporter-1
MRQSLGTAVFFGMLGVTLFGLIFTPTFYTVVRQVLGKASPQKPGSIIRGGSPAEFELGP